MYYLRRYCRSHLKAHAPAGDISDAARPQHSALCISWLPGTRLQPVGCSTGVRHHPAAGCGPLRLPCHRFCVWPDRVRQNIHHVRTRGAHRAGELRRWSMAWPMRAQQSGSRLQGGKERLCRLLSRTGLQRPCKLANQTIEMTFHVAGRRCLIGVI